MATVYQAAKQFRAELLRKDAAAAAQLLRIYGQAYSRIRAALDDLLAEISAAEAAGETINTAWLYRRERLQGVLDRVSVEIAGFATYAEASILNGQTQAVRDAERHALDLLALGSQSSREGAIVALGFDSPPIGALQALAGRLADGSPLRSLFNKFGMFASHAAEEALVSGVAQGKGVRSIGKELGQALDIVPSRARTIARTEVLRVYRDASAAVYQANSRHVDGWYWIASLSSGTCPVCYAMHGTWHPNTEEFGSHVNCRCTAVPAVLGVPMNIKPGTEVFADYDEARQLSILGPATFNAYKAGDLTLHDLVDYHVDPDWGPMRTRRPLRDVLSRKS